MKTLAALDSNHVALACQGGEHDVCSIRLKDLADLVQATKQDAIDLGGGDRDVLNVEPNPLNSFVELLLCQLDGLGSLASDEDIRGVSAGRVRWAVAVHLRERRRKVDGSPSGRLNQLDVLAVAATDELVAGQFELGTVYNTAELRRS